MQSLLDVTLNRVSCPRFSKKSNSSKEEEETYREDVKVTKADIGLYKWLIKIISVNGVIGDRMGGAGRDTGEGDE